MIYKYSLYILLIFFSINNLVSEKDYTKYNLGPAVNSEYNELGPLISHDGKTIYFIRADDPRNFGSEDYQDIWYSEMDENGKWQEAKRLKYPINNEYPNFISSICTGANSLLLGNTYNSDGSMGQGLSITHKTKTGWSFPINFRIENYYNLSKYASFNMSASGNVLLMSVQRKDSYGLEDIYVSHKINEYYWSEPRNLGKLINSPESEFSPFIASDDRTLYFSSAGHEGEGAADLFMSHRLDSTWMNWSRPRNLGKLINTEEGEGYLSIDASGEWAYFVSLENTIGGSDIFKMRLPDSLMPHPVVLISGKVIARDSNTPDSMKVKYEILPDGKVTGCSMVDPTDGSYRIVLPSGSKYGFWAEAEDFVGENEFFDATKITSFTEIEKDLYIVPVQSGSTLVMNNLFFDFDKASIRPESYPELNRIADFLHDNPGVTLFISGHTDNIGTDQYNDFLSKKRAKAVVDFLVERGIDSNRLSYTGFGEKDPVIENTSAKNRQMNRRVEFEMNINKK